MFKKLVYIIVLTVFFISCKSNEPITLPEHVIEMDDPFKTPSRPIYNASNTKEFDLIHTKLAVRFNWEKAHMYGKAEITLVPHFYTQNQLVLDARGMDLNKVQLMSIKDSLPSLTDLKYTYKDDKITIALTSPYTKEDTIKVFIDYTSKPNELAEGGSAAIKSDKGLYFINEKGEDQNKPMQIWTQGETQSNSAWFPTIDSPNQKSTEEIAITVNEKYKTLSNGVLSHSEENGDGTRTDFWEQNMKHAPYLFMMTIGEFEIYKDTWRDIEVNYYVEKEYAPYAKDMFGLTPEMLEFFSNKLGVDYPWQKYSQVIVRDYVSGAMENTSAVIFGEFTHQTKRDMIDGSSGEDVISHELFHHWFGDLVTCESWSNLPLNESFATYGEFLWREHKYGDDKAAQGLQSDLNSYLQEVSKGNYKDMVRFDFKSREDMFDRHTYQKGGRILHMLRNYIGDEAFFASLKLYLETNQYTDVEMHQLRLACEKITGEDLNWFFNQWFYAKGHPELNINYSYSDSAKTQTVTVEQMQKLNIAPLYYLPVNIDIYLDGKVKTHKVVIDKLTNEFTFDAASKPDLVNFDSDKMLLCEKVDNHTTMEEWAFMYNNAPRYMDRYEAIQKLSKSEETIATKTMITALGDTYPYLKRVTIRRIKKAVKNNEEKIKNKLLALAKNDSDSKVRGDALSALSIHFKDDEAVKKALVDGAAEESYYVIASALEGLSATNYEDAMKFAKSFETEKNSDIQSSISNIYATHGGKAQNAYFTEKIKNTEGFGRYSLVSNYGKYLKNQDNETVKSALPILKDVALNEDTWWIRLTGINAIADLDEMYANRTKIAEKELKELKAGDSKELELRNAITKDKAINVQLTSIMDEIKAAEKNPRLRKMIGLTD
ncbi:MAG: M1 family metallopeptidase [Vicingaceae bacterium]|nr:M1 family metallopeptidase [Vicingaceae bacterium]